MTDLLEKLDMDSQYVGTVNKRKQTQINTWFESQLTPEKEEPKTAPQTSLEGLRDLPPGEYQKKLKELGIEEEPGLIQPGKDPNLSFIQNTIGTLTDPVEWLSLGGGGAWQAGRAGKSIVGGAIDWATLGIPSLAKGIKGAGKGLVEGLGAKAKEATKPLKGGIAGATPELKIGAETIKEGIQPTVAKLSNVMTKEEWYKDVIDKMRSMNRDEAQKAGDIYNKIEKEIGGIPIGTKNIPEYVYQKMTEKGLLSKIKPEVTQPTAALTSKMDPKLTADAERVASTLDSKITETGEKIKKLAGDWEGITEKATRGHIPREEARAKGKELGMTIDTIKSIYPGTPMNAEQASALIDTITPIADDSVNAAQKYLKTRSPEDLHEALYKFYSLMEIDPKRFGVLAEAGRTLGQLNEPLSGINQYLNQFSKVFSELVPEGLTPEYLVHLIAHFERPEQLAIMARHAAAPGSVKAVSNALMEGWIMGLLSGPTTHVVNFTSNMLTMALGVTERAIAPRLAFGKGVHVAKGEATEMLYGIVTYLGDAFQTFYKVLKSGNPEFTLTKAEWYGQKAISAEALNLKGVIGTATDYMGEALRMPGRFLAAADDFSKMLNFNGEIRALALREGTNKGLIGQPLAEFIENYVKNPKSSAVELAREYASYQTFTKELGKVGSAYQEFVNSNPLLKVLSPFVRTPINLTKYSLERTPILNALSSQLRADIAAGGAKRDLALAKISTGMTAAAATLLLVKSGYITGQGPRDKRINDEWREAGWSPNSIYDPEEKKFVSWGRVDPFSTTVSAIASFAEVADELDDPSIEQYAAGLVVGFLDNLSTKTYIYTIGGLYDMIRSGNIGTSTVFKRMAGSIVPTLFRQIGKEIDPVMREVNSVSDAFINAVPGWSTTLPARIDLSGKERVHEGGWPIRFISPAYKSTLKDDPVWKEITNNRISISRVSKSVGGLKPPSGILTEETEQAGIELTPEDHEKLSRMAGNDFKIGGKGMWDTLTELVKSPSYKSLKDGPNGSKSDAIKRIVYKYRAAATQKFIGDNPDLFDAIIEKKKMRIEVKKPK